MAEFSRFLVEFKSSQEQANQQLVSSVGDSIKKSLDSMVSPLSDAITSASAITHEGIFAMNENLRGIGDLLEQLIQETYDSGASISDELDESQKQEAAIQADTEAEEERTAALKKSDDDAGLEDGKGEFAKKLKEQTSGIFAGLKGIFFGTAGIFAGIYLFIAALGNEKFREVVFKATDAVKQAFTDFGELINGDMGLLEFLKENALTVAAITALLMPSKTFGLLFKAVKYLPIALGVLKTAFLAIKGVMLGSIMPVLAPIILVVGAVSAVLFSIKKGFDDFKEKLDDTGSITKAITFGISSFLGSLLSLPATLFKMLVDGVLGLLEFITFGWLNFDEIQQKIRDLDFAGIMRDAIYNTLVKVGNYIKNTVMNAKQFLVDLRVKLGTFTSDLVSDVVTFIKGIGKKIYDPETGAIFGKVLPAFPTLGDIGQFLKDKAKLIYDSDTGAIFGYQLPELPSISKMFDKLEDLAKRIYDPDTGAIFGFIPGEVFNFKLPNIGDLFMNLIGSVLPDPNSLFGKGLYKLPGTDMLEEAARAYSEGGKMIDGEMTMPDSTTSLDNMKLDSMEAKKQYEMLMKKIEENKELTDKQKSFINQYNIMNGGNSVSQSSSSGVSIKKSATNDDYTIQMLAGSYA